LNNGPVFDSIHTALLLAIKGRILTIDLAINN